MQRARECVIAVWIALLVTSPFWHLVSCADHTDVYPHHNDGVIQFHYSLTHLFSPLAHSFIYLRSYSLFIYSLTHYSTQAVDIFNYSTSPGNTNNGSFFYHIGDKYITKSKWDLFLGMRQTHLYKYIHTYLLTHL